MSVRMFVCRGTENIRILQASGDHVRVIPSVGIKIGIEWTVGLVHLEATYIKSRVSVLCWMRFSECNLQRRTRLVDDATAGQMSKGLGNVTLELKI